MYVGNLADTARWTIAPRRTTVRSLVSGRREKRATGAEDVRRRGSNAFENKYTRVPCGGDVSTGSRLQRNSGGQGSTIGSTTLHVRKEHAVAMKADRIGRAATGNDVRGAAFAAFAV